MAKADFPLWTCVMYRLPPPFFTALVFPSVGMAVSQPCIPWREALGPKNSDKSNYKGHLRAQALAETSQVFTVICQLSIFLNHKHNGHGYTHNHQYKQHLLQEV